MECGSLSQFFFSDSFFRGSFEPDVQGIEATPSDGQQLITASNPPMRIWPLEGIFTFVSLTFSCFSFLLCVFPPLIVSFLLFLSLFGLLCVISGHCQAFCLFVWRRIHWSGHVCSSNVFLLYNKYVILRPVYRNSLMFIDTQKWMHDEAKKVLWTSFVFALRYDCLKELPSHPSPLDKYWGIRYLFNPKIYMIMAVQARIFIKDDIKKGQCIIKYICKRRPRSWIFKSTLTYCLLWIGKRRNTDRKGMPYLKKNKSIISNYEEIRKLETFIIKYELNKKTKYNYMRLLHRQSKNINTTPFVKINWAFHDRIRAALAL